MIEEIIEHSEHATLDLYIIMYLYYGIEIIHLYLLSLSILALGIVFQPKSHLMLQPWGSFNDTQTTETHPPDNFM